MPSRPAERWSRQHLEATPDPLTAMPDDHLATLARDLARLGPSAELVALKCFDLFPQTAHVESVAVFDFARGAA